MRSTRRKARRRKATEGEDTGSKVVEQYRMSVVNTSRHQKLQFQSKQQQERNALIMLICGAYAMICSVWGLVFPLTEALTLKELGHQHFPQVFAIYLYTFSIIFMVYLLYNLFGKRPPKDTLENVPLHGSSSSIHVAGIEGAGIYIRIGGRVFGLGGMAFNALRLAAHINDFVHTHDKACESVLFVLENILQLVFTGMQMIFVYKCNRIVIRHNPQLARFCLTHLMVTNVRTWFNSLVHETVEDMATLEAAEHGSNSSETGGGHMMVSGGGDHTADGEHAEHIEGFCHAGLYTMVHDASRYLTPCIIEYSIISAVVVYCIYENIGYRATSEELLQNAEEEKFEWPKLTCGLVAGIVPVFFTICSISIQFMFKDQDISLAMFYATSHIMFFLNTGAILIGFWATRHLHFHISDHGTLDIILLFISLIGNYCFQVFTLAASWPHVKMGELEWLQAFIRALEGVIQPIFQTVFILEGLRKHANTPELVEEKPGRNIILFILNCNLSLWIVETFAASQIDRGRIMEIFGKETWLIMFHLFIPFVIFYRFHSTACLAEICGEAYSEKNLNEQHQ